MAPSPESGEHTRIPSSDSFSHFSIAIIQLHTRLLFSLCVYICVQGVSTWGLGGKFVYVGMSAPIPCHMCRNQGTTSGCRSLHLNLACDRLSSGLCMPR